MILKDKKYAFLFLAPALTLITVFLFNPLIQTLYFSLTDWHYFSMKKSFIGLENYRRLLHDPVVGIAIKNTLLLIVLCIIFEIGFALLLAMLMDGVKRGFKIYRTVFFFPVVVSGSAIGLLFSLTYQYDAGLLNNILGVFGMSKTIWLTEKSSALLSMMPYVWQMTGFYFVIFMTALTKIPSDIYESASLDGATGLTKSIYITLPLIRDVIITTIALVITSAIKVFDIIFTITQGGPMNSSQVLSTYIYQTTFQSMNQGYGSALSILMVVIGIGLTIITTLISRKDPISY
ncbi:sugar ABC transporter permease [Clostridium estertheticum]|uniref:carbohydrate ABC transporter permease n=1 Tax=Clostridium estertheticum TaxID=238834 RepID=UPI0013EEA860|nr:sugar ABC transporter permease [Clostridium estertheticum]MBZ9607520.1 sugar ABC transporter permease [Clostridium estertheticum]